MRRFQFPSNKSLRRVCDIIKQFFSGIAETRSAMTKSIEDTVQVKFSAVPR